MKINQQKSHKKRYILLGCAVILLAALGTLGLMYHNGIFNKNQTQSKQTKAGNTINYDKPTSDQAKAGAQIKQKNADQNYPSGSKGSSSSNSSDTSTLKVQITAASASNGTAYIRSSIDGVYQGGSCTLTLTKGAQSITKTAAIQALPQSSTCEGFNIPTSQLSPGTWNIKLAVTVNSQTATTTGELEV